MNERQISTIYRLFTRPVNMKLPQTVKTLRSKFIALKIIQKCDIIFKVKILDYKAGR